MPPRLHLAIGLNDAGWHPAAWREPRARARELLTAAYWLDQVREAQRGLMDFVTIEDSVHQDAGGRTDRVRARLDAIMVASRVAPSTSGIGIVPSAATTVTEPLLVSTQIATLDFVTRGRAGWLAQVSTRDADGGYVGPRPVPPPAERRREAADGAEIRDDAANRFVDRERLHYVDFDGAYFDVKGPSITPRPPQGQPIIATPARGDEVDELADVVFVTDASPPIDPAGPIAFADVDVFLDEDASAAAERKARLDALDGAVYRADAPVFIGTPAQLADELLARSRAGIRGFRLRPAAVPHDLEAITRELVAHLQARGAFRREYESATLRGLLGLARPANRYAAA
jgi:alkanesulfonate monooxygenase SsuD/methylene tetrahydromethanopterin reductase-like flavin-dependent oxidoreductase (luciferase family)